MKINKKKLVFFALLIFSLAVIGFDETRKIFGTIRSYNSDIVVNNVPIYYPNKIEEVQSLIKEAVLKNINVRFSGTSHSTNSVILGSGIYIKSDNFNHIFGIEESESGKVVSVESGVKLGELHAYLAKQGYSLGFAYPFYHGISIGGLLATGSHGSSRKHIAQSSQNVVEATLVNGQGEIVTASKETPELLKAARVNLGLLGFVQKVKLKIYKDFNLQFYSYDLKDETALIMPDGQVNWGNLADTEYVYWYPQSNRGVKIEGNIVDLPADNGAECVVLGANQENLQSYIIAKLLMLGKNNLPLNKILENQMYKGIQGPPPYVKIENNKEVKAQGIVGSSSKMLLSKKAPPLNPAYGASDFSFSFNIKNAPQVLGAIREFSLKNNLSFPLVGIFMRFASNQSASYLSHIEYNEQKDGVYVMAEFYEPKYHTSQTPDNMWRTLTQNLLQSLIEKNLITFHWGKSTDRVFSYQANKKLLSKNIEKFNKLREEMDPNNIFVNDFAKKFIMDKY